MRRPCYLLVPLVGFWGCGDWKTEPTTEASNRAPIPNRAPLPVDSIQRLELVEGDTTSLDIRGYFADPDGDTLAYTVESSSVETATATADGNRITVAAITQGSATITVTASDPGGLSASLNFDVTVGRPPLIVAFADATATAPEGGTAVLNVQLSRPSETPLTVAYTLGVDEDPTTDDADTADFDGPGGLLHVPIGTDSIPIEIAIHDDDEIESTREVFIVSLTEPDSATGYVLGHATRAIVTIEEGVCDRTPPVRDAIVRQARASTCTDVQSSDLASLIQLTIVPGGSPVSSTDDASHDWSTLDPLGSLDSVPDQSPKAGLLNPDPLTLRPGDLSGLPGLYHLNIRHFELALPEEFLADLPGLGVLRLENTHLNDFPWQQLLHTPGLRLLNLEANSISRLPSRALATLSSLWSLNLAGNQFSELPEEAFAGLSKLESLFLGTNPLVSLPSRVFSELTALRRLGLHRIATTELPSDVFLPLRNLARLDFNYTPIRAIPSLAGLSELQVLNLSYNRHLTELPQGFEDLHKLDWLQLTGNSGLSLRPDMFAGFDELRSLFLGSMAIEELPPRLFSGLPSLQILSLHGNRLRSLPGGAFSGLGELSRLYLYGNRLTELPAGIFQGLSSLRALRLDDNPGAPFALGLEVVRADTSDALAPGPATVEIRLAEGAPLRMGVPLTVHHGNLSAKTVELDRGNLVSTSAIVSPATDNQEGTQVVAGPAPPVPALFEGIELKVGDPLILFDTVSNRAPVAERAIQRRRLRADGTGRTVIASSHFRDPDGDDLTYTAMSNNPAVLSTTVVGDRIALVPQATGSATVTVIAVDSGGLGAELSLRISVVGGQPGLFDIDLILIDEVSSEVQAAFDDAIAFWSAILAETDLPDVNLDEDLEVGCWDVTTDERLGTVDDLVIVASVRLIDGGGGVLAGAGPCGLRDESLLPFMGAMVFDAEDIEWLAETDDLLEVVAHEIGHVLGIGTIWEPLDLLRNPSLPSNQGADTHFRGSHAIAAFDSAGGTEYTEGEKVPVENRARRGSGDSHWREDVLENELMTPYQDVGIFDPLSAITIQSLADLGYTVDVSLAEAFTLPRTTAADVAQPRRKLAYGEDILRGPIVVVDRNGRVVRVISDPR